MLAKKLAQAKVPLRRTNSQVALFNVSDCGRCWDNKISRPGGPKGDWSNLDCTGLHARRDASKIPEERVLNADPLSPEEGHDLDV